MVEGSDPWQVKSVPSALWLSVANDYGGPGMIGLRSSSWTVSHRIEDCASKQRGT